MALQIMKVLASATTVTTVSPVNTKLFYVTTAQTDGGGTLTIDAADFFWMMAQQQRHFLH